jgi:hypothetical protein
MSNNDLNKIVQDALDEEATMGLLRYTIYKLACIAEKGDTMESEEWTFVQQCKESFAPSPNPDAK